MGNVADLKVLTVASLLGSIARTGSFQAVHVSYPKHKISYSREKQGYST